MRSDGWVEFRWPAGDVRATMIYTQVLNRGGKGVRSAGLIIKEHIGPYRESI